MPVARLETVLGTPVTADWPDEKLAERIQDTADSITQAARVVRRAGEQGWQQRRPKIVDDGGGYSDIVIWLTREFDTVEDAERAALEAIGDRPRDIVYARRSDIPITWTVGWNDQRPDDPKGSGVEHYSEV